MNLRSTIIKEGKRRGGGKQNGQIQKLKHQR